MANSHSIDKGDVLEYVDRFLTQRRPFDREEARTLGLLRFLIGEMPPHRPSGTGVGPLSPGQARLKRYYDSLPDFHGDAVGAGRRAVTRIRNGLREYYRMLPHTAPDPLVLELPEASGEWAYVPTARWRHGRLSEFWWPYLRIKDHETILSYGVPLFDQRRETDAANEFFWRRVDVNRKRELEAHYEEVGLPGRPRPNRRYISRGEGVSMMTVTDWLARKGVPLIRHRADVETTLTSLVKGDIKAQLRNLFAVGSVRNNGVISSLQEEDWARLPAQKRTEVLDSTGTPLPARTPIRIDIHNVSTADDGPFGAHEFDDRNVGSGRSEVPVVLTRRPGVYGGTDTIVASNHGLGAARIVEALTSTDQAERDQLFSSLPGDGLPEFFQILFLVEVADAGWDVPGGFSPRLAWSWQTKGGTGVLSVFDPYNHPSESSILDR